MAVTQVQAASGFATAASTTFAATFSTAVTAGNLIIYCIGGDKNIGTLTLTGYTKTVDTRSTDNSTSLVIAWKTAVGGETTISGTISGANAGGSEVRVFEWAESGAGAWEVKGSAVNTSTGATVTTISSGTTGTVTSAGRAIAGFSADSVGTEGTVSYSNSFTASASTPTSGGGNAGFWAAQKDIASGTAETTIDRTVAASADQMNGGIVVFGRVVTTTIAPTGIASAEAFGTAVVSQAILATGATTEEAFGTPTVSLNITCTGIASAQAFGTTTVAVGGFSVLPTGIASAEAFGEPVLTTGVHHTWLGEIEVAAVKLGENDVSLYLGETLVFS
jgi:hypothetical protein